MSTNDQKRLLIVEGDTDDAFFKEIISLEQLERRIEIKQTKGKAGLNEALRTVARTSSKSGVAKDLDEGTNEDVLRWAEDILRPEGYSLDSVDNILKKRDMQVIILPMGILDDPLLSSLQVEKHSLDDIILKTLLMDPYAVKHFSKDMMDAPKLEHSIRKVLGSLRGQDLVIDSSKAILEIAKAIMNFGASSAVFARQLVSVCDKDLLKINTSTIFDKIRSLGEKK